ncbi:hypothetical protein HPT25_27675 [Bacillus sp. BRMEA1]|uniref:hypothetical protein n=1 Tax=Neobacillus endophyticus TaxID=2738405 RepID=UPI00156455BC|nr:hypothetical protein [Neobacillus endophyticus]NRD81076.1 hypothetical protein [Neobacillus endophyticus]
MKLIITLGIFIVLLPVAFFIGLMATDDGVLAHFWRGFLWIEGVPLFFLVLWILELFLILIEIIAEKIIEIRGNKKSDR